MKKRNLFIFGLLSALGVVIACMMLSHRKAEPIAVKEPPVQAAIVQVPEFSQPPPSPEIPAVEIVPEAPSVVSVAPVKTASGPSPKKQNAGNSTKPKKELQDPDARAALSFVGADPVAEAYWLAAIFDPSLPDSEREDLMEDLNEEGLSDPKHPTPDDLVLIWNRLPAIENAWADADPFMQRHLWEAYKDLLNLLAGNEVQ